MVISSLIEPHGGQLVSPLADDDRAVELAREATTYPSWRLSNRQACDLELLLVGAFSPLAGYLGEADYRRVCESMRLTDGTLWPIPVTLDVSDRAAAAAEARGALALRDSEGMLLAVLTVTELWRPDLTWESRAVFGSDNLDHPGVAQLRQRSHPWYVAGRLEGLRLPTHWDFRELRFSPRQVRAELTRREWHRVVAFQTRNPIHRAHFALTAQAMRDTGAKLLLHPVVGPTMPEDIDYCTRVRCYRAAMKRYPADVALLSLLPLAMRMAGPREALWHAIIRKNFGATHFIVGRDHASPGQDSTGQPFYEPYEAQHLLRQHEAELGVALVPFKQMHYVEQSDDYLPEDQLPQGTPTRSLSGTELRARLRAGKRLPGWFTWPDVAGELRRACRSQADQGITVFLTGLPAAGKSTIARAVEAYLLERGRRDVTLLDGDAVRNHLSPDLGFSKEDRSLNIRRIGFVAAQVTKCGGIAICAAIAPYATHRQELRLLVEPHGRFVLVHVATPVELCEQRDPKGLYAKARAGEITDFTGVSDPYEEPADADVVIDTSSCSPPAATRLIVDLLRAQGHRL